MKKSKHHRTPRPVAAPQFATYDHRAEFEEELVPLLDKIHQIAGKYNVPMLVAVCNQCSPNNFNLLTRIHDPEDRNRTPALQLAAMSLLARPEHAVLWITAFNQIKMIDAINDAAMAGKH